MSLEEIESKLGSLIQPETITMLKSAVWKERLEGSNVPPISIISLLYIHTQTHIHFLSFFILSYELFMLY